MVAANGLSTRRHRGAALLAHLRPGLPETSQLAPTPGTRFLVTHFCISFLFSQILAVLPPVAAVQAQTVQFRLGQDSITVAAPFHSLALPLLLQTGSGAPTALAAFQVVLRWDPQRLHFDSLRTDRRAELTVTVNAATAPDGLLRFNGFSPTALGSAGPLVTVFVTPRRPAGAVPITMVLEAVGDESGRSMGSGVRARGHTICVERCV
jgi:hypothetical protein